MGSKKAIGIAGIVVAVIGIILLIFSNYIDSQVAAGRQKIKGAQQEVDQGKALFSLTPETKKVGDGMANDAQKKIDAGKAKVRHYSSVADHVQIIGVILIVVGGIGFVYGMLDLKMPKQKRRTRRTRRR